jgi:anti-sigma regulatory factor (Ser/Thr protein kinase)
MNPNQPLDALPVFEREITLSATIDNLDRLLEWIETVLGDSCPAGTVQCFAVVTEELFVNIANYAYAGKTGDVTVRAGRAGEAVAVQFEDGGAPFNPLNRPDPKITGDIEDRTIGGLGIYLVKKMMDHVTYRWYRGKNLFTVFKTPENPD